MSKGQGKLAAAREGADIVFRRCAPVTAGESVLVVADFDTLASAVIVAEAGRAAGAAVELIVMPARAFDGQEPTATVAAAMQNASLVLTPVTRSLAHADATRKALAGGARVLSLTASSPELLASRAYRADFERMRPVCRRVAELFSLAGRVTVSTPAGTELEVSAEGRPGQAHSCIVDQPGQFSSAPNIEASFAPVEGSMQGIFVADASIPYLGIGLLDEPVVFTIERGRVVGMRGGRAARTLESIWRAQEDPNVYNIAQVAIGLNPEIEAPVGRLGCNYDEGAFGTAHIGIGTSSNLGGAVKATTHFDALMTRPTITLDGKAILRDGALCLD